MLLLNLQKTQDREVQWSWSGFGAADRTCLHQKHWRSAVFLLCNPGVHPLCGSEPEGFDLCEDYCAKTCSRTGSRSVSRRPYCDQKSNRCLSPFSWCLCTTRLNQQRPHPTPPPSSSSSAGPFCTEPGDGRWICQGDQGEPGPQHSTISVCFYQTSKDTQRLCWDPPPLWSLQGEMKHTFSWWSSPGCVWWYSRKVN